LSFLVSGSWSITGETLKLPICMSPEARIANRLASLSSVYAPTGLPSQVTIQIFFKTDSPDFHLFDSVELIAFKVPGAAPIHGAER
jgi:hypothetical protein